LYYLASFYSIIGKRCMGKAAPNVVTNRNILTARQIECLRWVRAGKSSHDIGAIIGISGDVVDEHIAKACRRMGVRTRIQAALRAAEGGFLTGTPPQVGGVKKFLVREFSPEIPAQ
jgi:DNA-binding CsgD family transcriptional regulator